MKSIKHNEWKSPLYLDAVGSLAVIAVSATIFLAGAAGAMELVPSFAAEAVEVCAVTRVALLDAEDLAFQCRGATRYIGTAGCALV